jgi:hypothetical protein
MSETLAQVLAQQATLTALQPKVAALRTAAAAEAAKVTSILPPVSPLAAMAAKAVPVAPVATVAPKSTLLARIISFFRFI